MLFINWFSSIFKLKLKLLTPYLSILLITCFVNNVLAKPLEEYCISKVKPAQPKFSKQNGTSSRSIQENELYQRPSRTATFFRSQEQFIVESRGGLDLTLRREGEETVIQKLTNFVQKDEWISYIFITKDNWLFIHADYNNYMIDLNTPEPTLGYGKPRKIPFYGKKCNRWQIWFNGGCPVSIIYHSQTLGRAIIPGYYPADSGHKWTTVEIVAGEIKVLESPKPIGNIAADLPEFGGAILRTVSNGALFYDGKNITELELDLPKKKFSDQYPSWKVIRLDNSQEHKGNKLDERIYITNAQFAYFNNEAPHFVIEVKKEPRLHLINIPFPKELDHQGLWEVFFSFPNDTRKWGIAKNSILFELSGKYQTVLLIPKPYQILHEVRRQGVNGAIVFDVLNEKTKSSTTYYLKQATPSAQCEIMLYPNNPIELSVD